MVCLGLDFGTSNTTAAISFGQNIKLLPIDNGETSMPSAIFFDYEERQTKFGRQAIDSYVDGYEGRFMRALKSILGTSLESEFAYVQGKRVAFQDILSLFLSHIRQHASAQIDEDLTDVVLGRPVHFVDGDEEADRKAQNTLYQIAQAAGFKNISFQYEPIAAALDHENSIDREELALIVDLGGGTSDFTIIKVDPKNSSSSDRKENILALGGVHVGGTDFDRELNLKSIMPLFGYKSQIRREFGQGLLEIPHHLYHSLSTWQLIHLLYNRETLSEAHGYLARSTAPLKLKRLIAVLEERLGHRIVIAAEHMKIELTAQDASQAKLDFIEEGLNASTTRETFEKLSKTYVDKIVQTLKATISRAEISRDSISTVFLTGGTTAIPLVRRAICSAVPKAKVLEGDRFGSVGVGLAIEAKRRFG